MSDLPPWDGKERRRQVLHGQEEILTRLDQLNSSVAKVVCFIEGNGNPERGAIVRLDRVERSLEKSQQVHDRRSTWMWGSIGGLALKQVWDFLIKSR